ncbi:Uncharacterised protein [uncultured archaeon]|nr:Uncharacterised protein [uncultured archaeon]
MARGDNGKKSVEAFSGDVITEVKAAEDSAAKDVAKAKERREQTVRKAQEKARAIREKSSADAEAVKAKSAAEANEKIAVEEKAIISDAQKEVESVRRKRADGKFVDAALESVMEDLNAAS